MHLTVIASNLNYSCASRNVRSLHSPEACLPARSLRGRRRAPSAASPSPLFLPPASLAADLGSRLPAGAFPGRLPAARLKRRKRRRHSQRSPRVRGASDYTGRAESLMRGHHQLSRAPGTASCMTIWINDASSIQMHDPRPGSSRFADAGTDLRPEPSYPRPRAVEKVHSLRSGAGHLGFGGLMGRTCPRGNCRAEPEG
jgi:hypothetical protein